MPDEFVRLEVKLKNGDIMFFEKIDKKVAESFMYDLNDPFQEDERFLEVGSDYPATFARDQIVVAYVKAYKEFIPVKPVKKDKSTWWEKVFSA